MTFLPASLTNRPSQALPEWSFALQVFVYLQLLDVLTTWVGLRAGLGEASPVIQFMMRFGPLAGLVSSKLLALALGAFCIRTGRARVIQIINYWYGALVVWNLGLILSR